MKVERHVGIDEVEPGLRAVRRRAGVVDAGGDAAERRVGLATHERADFAQPGAARSWRAETVGWGDAGRKNGTHLPFVGERLFRRRDLGWRWCVPVWPRPERCFRLLTAAEQLAGGAGRRDAAGEQLGLDDLDAPALPHEPGGDRDGIEIGQAVEIGGKPRWLQVGFAELLFDHMREQADHHARMQIAGRLPPAIGSQRRRVDVAVAMEEGLGRVGHGVTTGGWRQLCGFGAGSFAASLIAFASAASFCAFSNAFMRFLR